MTLEPVKGLGALMRLKSWFTLADAAKYLSVVFDTEISPADVLRFALDGQLRLSVRFVNGACVRRVRRLEPEELEERLNAVVARLAEIEERSGKGNGPIPAATTRAANFNEADRVFVVDDEVFDLLLAGGDRLDVENEYQRLSGGPAVTGIWPDATLIEAADGSLLEVMARLGPEDRVPKSSFFDPANYFHAGTLGSDVVFVVRTSAIRALESALGGEAPSNIDSKPVAARERSTLLTLIAALAQHSKIDISKPAQAAERLEGLTVDLGARVASRTILEHLKRVPDALERKAQD